MFKGKCLWAVVFIFHVLSLVREHEEMYGLSVASSYTGIWYWLIHSMFSSGV